MKVKSGSEITQLCLTLSNPMDCSLAGFSMGFSRQEHWSGVPLPSLCHFLAGNKRKHKAHLAFSLVHVFLAIKLSLDQASDSEMGKIITN